MDTVLMYDDLVESTPTVVAELMEGILNGTLYDWIKSCLSKPAITFTQYRRQNGIKELKAKCIVNTSGCMSTGMCSPQFPKTSRQFSSPPVVASQRLAVVTSPLIATSY
jgi:hypothetical protein